MTELMWHLLVGHSSFPRHVLVVDVMGDEVTMELTCLTMEVGKSIDIETKKFTDILTRRSIGIETGRYADVETSKFADVDWEI